MDIFTKNKWTSWLVVMLILVNLMSFAAIWVQQNNIEGILENQSGKEHPKERPNHRPQGPDPRISEALGFDAQQNEQYQQIWTEREEKSQALLQQHRMLNDSLAGFFKGSDPDKETMRALSIRLSTLDSEVRNLGIEYHFQLREICSEAQKEKLKAWFSEIHKRRNHKGPRGQHPPGGGGPDSRPGGGPPPH